MAASLRKRLSRVRPLGSAGDLAGGLSGGLTSLPASLAIGFIALSPLGADAQGNGASVSLLAAAVGGALFTLFNRTRGVMAGGSVSFALVVAAAMAEAQQAGLLQPGPTELAGALAIVTVLTLLTGVFTAVLALSGLGQIVSLLPYPVVSGIRNGSSVLLILTQLRPMLGLSGTHEPLGWPHPAAVAVSGLALLLMLRPIRRLRPIPPALVAIAAGAGAQYFLSAVLLPRGQAGSLGPLLDAPNGLAHHLGTLRAGWALLPQLPLQPLVATVVPAALSIALMTTLETLVGASVMQDVRGERNESRTDLLAAAAANIGNALCGAFPVTGGSSASMAVWTSGGRTKAAGLLRALLLLVLALVAGPAIGALPVAALSGIMVATGLRTFDHELLRLARTAMTPGTPGRTEMVGNLLVSVVVIALAMVLGLVAAVLTGFVLSALMFVVAMSGRIVRRRYGSVGGRSRTVRSEAETAALLRHGAEVQVIELQGAVFFGSADPLVRAVDDAWAGGARCVILDVKRVSQIDLSGARRVLQLATRYWAAGAFLAFAEMGPGSPMRTYYEALGLWRRLRSDRVFASLPAALAEAELVLLQAHGVGREAAGAATDVLARLGLPQEAAATLLAHAPERCFAAGEAIIRAGDGADALFVLLEGEVEVLVPSGAGHARVATLTAGTLFGEMALLSGATRSADVTPRTPVRCLCLSVDTVSALRQSEPELAYHLMAAIAGQLASNVLMANVALASLAD